MKNKKKLLLMLALAVSVSIFAGGCDKLKKEPQTEPPTEAPTEAPTEPQTQPPTEAPTESETQPPTEPQTQPPTEPETQRVLTAAEEKAQETQFDQIRMMYAMDDVNVREQPDTSSNDNIFYSYYQGDQVIVVGETPNWYVVDVEGYDVNGYMSKQFVSDTEVSPKTEEEREQLIEQELSGTVTTSSGETASGGSGTSAPAGTDTSAIDQEYNVQSYAESYSVYAMTGANLRAKPAQDSEILQTVPSGSSLTAIGYTDKWYKVDMNGTVGYVNKNLFSTEPVA